MARELAGAEQIQAALAELDSAWSGSTAGLRRSIEFADFPTAVEFIVALARFAEDLDHHPDLDLRWRRVDVALSTHSAGGVTDLDLQLARIVDQVAQGLPRI